MMQKIGMRPLTASCTHPGYGEGGSGGGGLAVCAPLAPLRTDGQRAAAGGACPKERATARPTATCDRAASAEAGV